MTTLETLKAVTKVDTFGYNVLPVTFAYIAALLSPYVDVLTITPMDRVAEWILLAMPSISKKVLKKYQAYPVRSEKENKEELIRIVAKIVLDITIEEVLDHNTQAYILPWDIQGTILDGNNDLYPLFQLPFENSKLPVIAVVNGNQYIHELSEEFTIGLLIAAKVPAHVPSFDIYMFGILLEDSFLADKKPDNYGARYYFNPSHINAKYSVDVGDKVFSFNTPEFIQGFMTGCQWRGLDYHDYLENLIQYDFVSSGHYNETFLQIN